MRHSVIRIALWASVGPLISAVWGFYFANTDEANPMNRIVYALSYTTQPAAGITHSYFDFPRGLRAVAIENATTYALIGSILEMILRRSGSYTLNIERHKKPAITQHLRLPDRVPPRRWIISIYKH
jgi:hypothetical protein